MHRMDMRSHEQYLKALLGRYLRARKRGKSALLDEYCRNTGMARKSVLRKIAGLLKGESAPRKQRRPVYGRPVRVALETLWEIFAREVLAFFVDQELLSPELAERLLSWHHTGFNVHSLVRAKTKMEAERMGKYMIRPLPALERLTFMEPEGEVGYRWALIWNSSPG